MLARDLYLDLGLSANNWTRWQKDNILENEFFKQDVDFVQLVIMTSAENPNPPKDYAVTIDMAKHIAMMAKTKRAHDYRNYFIECEKLANSNMVLLSLVAVCYGGLFNRHYFANK